MHTPQQQEEGAKMQVFLVLLIILIVFIIFIFGILFLMTRYKRVMLRVCTAFIAMGFVLYTAAFLSAGTGFPDALLAALRGIFSTARMFSLSDDYGVVRNLQGAEWLTGNIWMRTLLWLSHVSALIIIQTALLSLFGRKVMDEFRMRFGFHREVYVIKGSDKNALLLGENIATHDNPHQRPDVNRLVVFLLDEDEDVKMIYERSTHFGGIVQVLDRNHDLAYHLGKVGLGKINKRWKKYYVILMPQNISVPDDAHFIAEFAKERKVNPENLDIFAFITSEWNREKVEEITQAKENRQRKYPYTFHIISETDLLAREMIRKHPPFESTGLKFSKGMAMRDFTVLILGFGKVGQSALMRLIMNGQFVGSHMKAIVVDKKTENVRDCFLHRHPSIRLSCELEFKNFDVQCDEFYSLLNQVEHVDYVVVALDSDEINKEIAMDIRSHYGRREELDFPLVAVSEKRGCIHERKENERVFIFGCREEIYRESIVIREESDLVAKAVHDAYGSPVPWHELEWFYQESNRAAADFIPSMLHLANLTVEDALNRETLSQDNELAEVLAKTEKLRWNAFHVAMGYKPISIEEMHHRFEKFGTEGTARERLDFSRRDAKGRLHLCLVSWDELDEVSEAYRKLAKQTDEEKEQKKDFKDSDRTIVEYIPKFLKKVKEKKLES